MNIRIEATWTGHKMGFTVYIPNGGQYFVNGEDWGRKQATEALDIMEKLHGLTRRNIRFV